jgi:hypothetical protein
MAKTQTLSFPIRLPDAIQAEALRRLHASTIAINQIITDLWPQQDHQQIKEQVRALRAQMPEAGEDADTFMAMTNVIEQDQQRSKSTP